MPLETLRTARPASVFDEQPPELVVRLERRISRAIFLTAFGLRLATVLGMMFASISLETLSRDSAQYEDRAIVKAAQYERGEIEWARWIDDAWYELAGVLYMAIGPHILPVLLLNALAASMAAVLLYWVAAATFNNCAVGIAAGFLSAVFPSMVYYSALPLKEAAAQFGLMSISWGTIIIIARRRERPWGWLIGGLTIMLGLRAYLVPLLVGCSVLACFVGLSGPRLRVLPRVLAFAAVIGGTLLLGVKTGMVHVPEHEMFSYYDIDKVNQVRESLSRGNTRMYRENQAGFGSDVLDNARKVAFGALFFLFSLSPMMGFRERQLAALPEVLFFLYCLPCLWAGIKVGWRTWPTRVLPVILFLLTIVAVYGSATTNAGAMYRWRLQALPYFFMLIVFGGVVRARGHVFALVRRLRARFGAGSYQVGRGVSKAQRFG